MIDIWSVIRWAHLLAAIAWIGGMLFILIVLLPVMRRSVPSTERTLLVAQVGERYGVLSWVALSILVVTGVLNGERRSVAWFHLLDGEYGRTLALKLLLVAIVIPITLVHAFYYGRRITRLAEQAKEYGDDPALAAERRRLQRMSGILSAVNLLLNLAIVLLAAALVA
ncbi:DUF4149 domain-containing protein [Sphaerobacter sp.]|uniref:DUF4149 domain-containing protein n=1 Tax=Sphaerobacter sp. TaxID=2099654 RepID=UPI001D2A8672|nr:DUF4149 domain-containing protein [Sphaerobacter sp.]MBX5445401.1 DUF4149 domain-containing protein [Sphaerobacter sp.]